MKYCSHCQVTILDERDVCPLCHTVLGERKDGQDTLEADCYPDIAQKTEKWRRAFMIGAYFAVLAEATMVIINYLTTRHTPWSLITGAAILYVLLTLRDLPSRRRGHIRKIYFQLVLLLILLIAIDYASGWRGWSVNIGVPCILFAAEAVILIFMRIHSADWQNYLTMQIFMMLCSIAYLVLMLCSRTGAKVLAWVVFGVCTLTFTTTMVIGGRKAGNEVRRKFHV